MDFSGKSDIPPPPSANFDATGVYSLVETESSTPGFKAYVCCKDKVSVSTTQANYPPPKSEVSHHSLSEVGSHIQKAAVQNLARVPEPPIIVPPSSIMPGNAGSPVIVSQPQSHQLMDLAARELAFEKNKADFSKYVANETRAMRKQQNELAELHKKVVLAHGGAASSATTDNTFNSSRFNSPPPSSAHSTMHSSVSHQKRVDAAVAAAQHRAVNAALIGDAPTNHHPPSITNQDVPRRGAAAPSSVLLAQQRFQQQSKATSDPPSYNRVAQRSQEKARADYDAAILKQQQQRDQQMSMIRMRYSAMTNPTSGGVMTHHDLRNYRSLQLGDTRFY